MAFALSDRVIRRFLLDRVSDGSAVVDVGCGTGWATLLLARELPQCEIIGVDIDAGVVHGANRTLARMERSPRVRCVSGAAEELAPLLGRSRYDVAVSVHALHHYADPFRALRSIRAVLRPRGQLLLAEYEPRYGERLDDCPRFSLDKIAWLCADAGFTVVSAEEKRPGVLLVAAERS